MLAHCLRWSSVYNTGPALNQHLLFAGLAHRLHRWASNVQALDNLLVFVVSTHLHT